MLRPEMIDKDHGALTNAFSVRADRRSASEKSMDMCVKCEPPTDTRIQLRIVKQAGSGTLKDL